MKPIGLSLLLVVLVCQLSNFAFPQITATDDLILYFDFEDFMGDQVIEKSQSQRNGKINGQVMQADDGKFGKAGKFSAGSFLDLDGATFPKDNIPTEAWSLLAWINVEALSDMEIFNARAEDGTWLIHSETRDDDGGNYRWLLRASRKTPDDPVAGVTIVDLRAGKNRANEWVHYAGIYDGSKATLYINGTQVGEEKARHSDPVAGDWGKGARVGVNVDNARPFIGLMDDLNIWKKALTQDEIRSIMSNGVQTFLSSVNIPDPNLRSALEKALGKNEGDAITKEDLFKLKVLEVSDASVTDLSGLEFCTNLMELYLHRNKIKNISPLSSLTRLTTLYLWGNKIEDISAVSNLKGLTYLNLGGNFVGDIQVLEKLTNLTRLVVEENLILKDISPLSKLTKLNFLALGKNQIEDLSPITKLTKISNLWLSNNSISNISSLAENTGISGEIRLKNNPLSNTALSIHIPALEAK